VGILLRNNRSIRLDAPLPVDPETGLYTRNFFLLRLKEERERAKRSGSAFSLLIVDVEGISTVLTKKSRGSPRDHQRKLVEEIFSQARKIDIKGWFDMKNIGILMPYTEAPGVLQVKDKICHQIRENWPWPAPLNLEESFRTYTFSNDLLNENETPLDGDNPSSSDGSGDAKALYADLLHSNPSSSLKVLLKRILDIIGSLLGIIITAPLMLTIAILIKLTSPGPVLFCQERIGFLGRKFILLKFRSMVPEADQTHHQRYVKELINGRHETSNRGTKENPLYKINDDPRVIPFGLILRKTSLDELPQFFNILKGEMSLVGPRPPIQYEVDEYKLWHCGRVFEVKPGLTGLWQISARSQTSFDDMVRLDLHYADNWSLSLDFKIIFKTFWAVLSAKGAY
jgi:lipopolysaccharide/colanic/teichoic acid biosynthesis glycosyltransferase